MKKLNLLDQSPSFKVNDTGTIIPFNAFENNQPFSVTADDATPVFRIKNEMGFLKSVNATVAVGGYIFQLNTKDLVDLVPGTYQVELAVTDSKTNEEQIFPDTGFCSFNITDSAMTVTGTQIPTMSLDSFKNELQQYVENQAESKLQTIKSDFQTYVDNLKDSTIKQAQQASSDAQNAVSTANSANEKAQQAVNTANSMNEKIAANSTLISGNIKQINDLSAKLMPIYTEQTNMLINSTFINFNSWIHGNSATITSDKYNDSNIVQLAPGNGSNYLAQDVKGIDINDSYMVSVYVKGSSDSTLHCEFRGGTKADIQVTSDWKLVTFSGKFSDQSYTRFYMWNSGDADNIFIANPILTQWHMTLDMYNKLAGGVTA